MKILGVDPGVTGALALFDPGKSAASGLRWIVEDMPVVGDPAELNAGALRDFLQKYSPDHAFVELVNAMPVITNRRTGKRDAMPATSAFRFGGMFFSIKAVLGCCNIPLTLVHSAKWKKVHGLKGPDKEASRRRALQLYPELASELKRKMDQNRAEAALIAGYGDIAMGTQSA